ncbi:MAG: enoyl-CoA hydratase/isomerase family protein [Betaproteobacteria bacterium]|nr:MAG: enoyl-CoA hydratase/isomerase family protein [Betaproteobacteria bacterium]
MEELVRFSLAGPKQQVAIATLVREKPLNSLLLETIDQLADKINAWLADDSIACIVLDSSSDRAFCAGADITVMYRAIKDAPGGASPHAEAFFLHEYQLDYLLHTANKPIVVWGNGIVIGGGLGLVGGCSHRIGTPATRIAMPEITIGLFPDAGGTKFLSSMPDNLGLFAGLTGIHLSASDALELGLLDVIIEAEKKAEILEGVASLPWASDVQENHRLVTGLLEQHRMSEKLPTNLVSHRDRISELMQSCLDADDFFAVFEATETFGDDKLDAAMATYRKGSPTTARIFVEQMRRAKGMSLADMFRMELVIAYQCIRHGDFLEGVRALLIDKDKNPKWTYKSALDVPDSHVKAHFVPAWSGTHPLAALGN